MMNPIFGCLTQQPTILSLKPNYFSASNFTSFHNRNKSFILQHSQHQFKLKCRRTQLPDRECDQSFELYGTSSTISEDRNWIWADSRNDHSSESLKGFVVVNFYHFVSIQDPEDEVAKHLLFVQGRDIHGRIYLNEQGINAQFSGPYEDALAYVKWVQNDLKFSDILVQFSSATDGHAFPRLKLRYKPSLVQLEGGISHLPLIDSSARAIPLTPTEWRDRLEAVDKENGHTNCVILDVRNGYEWDIGHFHGAQRPDVDCFRSTSLGMDETTVSDSDPLADIDKGKTDILMYCTGGIRCDVYSVILRQRGFKRLYTLKGGISHYLKNEGPVKWVGNLFVFDSRLSLPPTYYHNPREVEKKTITEEEEEKEAQPSTAVSDQDNSLGGCYVCGSSVSEPRHRNCANLDCNLLFLCCISCVNELRGCCCLKCVYAPRLRPVLTGHQRYKRWHLYRDAESESR